MHPRWGCAFPVIHIPIPGEDESQWINILTGNGDVPHREAGPHRAWGCASPGMHILTGTEDVPHWECISSPGMGMCLTRNSHSHRECISSPGMHIVHTECLCAHFDAWTGNVTYVWPYFWLMFGRTFDLRLAVLLAQIWSRLCSNSFINLS